MPKKGQTKPKQFMKTRYRKMKVNGKTVQVHRYVMEQHIGRPLLSTELVHHINDDRYDNRIENLEIISPKEHSRLHNLGRKHSSETRAKVSASLVGNQRRKGKPHPEEMKKQISETLKKRRRENPELWSNRWPKSDN